MGVRRPLRSAGPALLLLAACALSAPPAASVLGGGAPAAAGEGADSSFAERAERWQVELDSEAKAALALADAAPADVDAALRATALLFQAADLRLQRATLALLLAEPPTSTQVILGADDRVADPARTEILSLCTAGLAAAERVVQARPESCAGHLHEGLHLSLISWANGPARSLFAGYGPRLVRAIDAALQRDAEFDHGAPLRLQGRFRSKAPWPYGDLALARTVLQRAAARFPNAVNQLFLGDALFAAGDRAAALQAWQLAETAAGDEATRWSTPLLQELARMRCVSLQGATQR